MMKPHHTGRVDQHVAPLLGRVGARYPRKPPSERLTAIGPHGGEPPEVPEPGRMHVVRPVEPPFGVHEQRPEHPDLLQIFAGRLPPLEGHHECLDPEPIQFLARLLQLQQVSAARQSEQMPVEHQQQPPATVVLEAMLPTLGIPQRKGRRGAADELCHNSHFVTGQATTAPTSLGIFPRHQRSKPSDPAQALPGPTEDEPENPLTAPIARLTRAATQLLVLGCLSVSACSSSSPTAPSPTPDPTPTLSATFSSIQSQIFEPECVRCHGTVMNAGLDLRAATGFASLVNTPSSQTALLRVAPGDPEASYLIHKVDGRAGIVGSRMPQGGPFLSTEQIAVIRSWITAGAANN